MQETDVARRRYYALMILGIALPLLLLPFLSALFLSADQSLIYRLVCSRFLIWTVFCLMILYSRYAEVQRFMLWDEEKYDILSYVSFTIFLFLLLFAGGIIARIPYWFGLHEKNEIAHKMQAVMDRYPALLVFTAFTAGIKEEFIFRGYMIPRLSLLFRNKHAPIIISALLFSFVHLGYKSLGELIFTFLFGITCGYHYQKYRNIQVLVMVHFLWDLMALMLAHHRHM